MVVTMRKPRLGGRESEVFTVAVLIVKVILEILKIGLEVIAEDDDLRSQGFGVVIARVLLDVGGGPEEISGEPASSRRLNDVGDDGTATHLLSFRSKSFLRFQKTNNRFREMIIERANLFGSFT